MFLPLPFESYCIQALLIVMTEENTTTTIKDSYEWTVNPTIYINFLKRLWIRGWEKTHIVILVSKEKGS